MRQVLVIFDKRRVLATGSAFKEKRYPFSSYFAAVERKWIARYKSNDVSRPIVDVTLLVCILLPEIKKRYGTISACRYHSLSKNTTNTPSHPGLVNSKLVFLIEWSDVEFWQASDLDELLSIFYFGLYIQYIRKCAFKMRFPYLAVWQKCIQNVWDKTRQDRQEQAWIF